MIRGIEAAFWGTLAGVPELKTGKSGKLFARMNVAVTVGQGDDGKDLTQWVRVSCFDDTAKQIAATGKKGDRVYVEGTLTLNQWTDKATGEQRHGLNVTAWKADRLQQIGRSRQFSEKAA